MLRRSEEGVKEEEVGVLRSGKRFQLSRVKRTATNREGECSSIEVSEYGSILPEEATFWETETTTSQYQSDDNSSQVGHCVGPTTPKTTQKTKVRPKSPLQTSFKSSGSKNSASQSQNSGSSAIVVSQVVPIGSAPRRMENDMRMHVFNENGSQDPKQHIFFLRLYGLRSSSMIKMFGQPNQLQLLEIEHQFGT